MIKKVNQLLHPRRQNTPPTASASFTIIAMSLSKEPNMIDLIKSLPRGDGAAVYKKLVETYGVVQSSSNQQLILQRLGEARKIRGEPIEEFIARMETLFRHLSVCGTTLDLAMRKHYILNKNINGAY